MQEWIKLFIFYLALACLAGAVAYIHYSYRQLKLKANSQWKTGDNPLVSVIIPTYNEAKVIKKTIESVTRQHYSNIEIIVVDDNSDDGTWEILSEMAREIPNLRIFRKIGPKMKPQSLNEAVFLHMKGQYGLVIDADTRIPPDYISKHLPEIITPKHNIVLTGYQAYNRNKNLLTWLQDNMFAWAELVTHGGLIGRTMLIGNGFFFKKKDFLVIGGLDPNTLVDDHHLSVKYYINGKTITFSDYPKSHIQMALTFRDFFHQQVRWFAGGIQETIRGMLWGDIPSFILALFFVVVLILPPMLLLDVYLGRMFALKFLYLPVVAVLYGLTVAALVIERRMRLPYALLSAIPTVIFMHYVYLVLPSALKKAYETWFSLPSQSKDAWYKVERDNT
jgi:1,2-diacylglycerol 3-beta-glucosyltransferase